MANKIEIKNLEIKTAEYRIQIIDANFFHDWLDKEGNTQPIKCQIISKLQIKIGNEKINKEISNTVFINPDEPIFKEIILHSKHIIIN